MSLTKVKSYLSPRKLILFGGLLSALLPALLLVHPLILDCSGYIGDPQTVGFVLAYIDDLYETFVLIAFLGLFVGSISAAIGIGWYIAKNANVWIITLTAVVILIFIYAVVSVWLASMSSARSKSPDAVLWASMSYLRPLAEEYVSLHGNYGLPTESCTKEGPFFATTEVHRRSGYQAECKSNGEEFVVAIHLIVQQPRDTGIFCKVDLEKRRRWCVDSAGNMRGITSFLDGYSCPEGKE
jgi:hypothetical protein